jgi:hypothetical protein
VVSQQAGCHWLFPAHSGYPLYFGGFGAFDFDYAEPCMQSLASKMQGIVSRLRFWRSGLAKDSDFHLRELHTIDSREGFSQNLIEHERSGIGPAETRIAHKHEPHPRLVTR